MQGEKVGRQYGLAYDVLNFSSHGVKSRRAQNPIELGFIVLHVLDVVRERLLTEKSVNQAESSRAAAGPADRTRPA